MLASCAAHAVATRNPAQTAKKQVFFMNRLCLLNGSNQLGEA